MSSVSNSRYLLATLAVWALATAACDDGPTGPSDPTARTVAVIRVIDQTYTVELTTPEQIAAAQRAQQGAQARIPIGRVMPGTGVNTGWSWHIQDVRFAEVTMEVCDGRPSDVERDGQSFGTGWFCPWSAQVLEIRAVPVL